MNAGVTCDVLVAGSGAGGLAAAIAAQDGGLEVIVAEKAQVFGGTTAWSGGWLWIPGNTPAKLAGVDDDIAAARRYLAAMLGPRFDARRIDAFLREGPAMVDFFAARTGLEWTSGAATPDFDDRLDGAGIGRSLCAAPFDGRLLGATFDMLRPPLQEITIGGMAIAAGEDLRHFLNALRTPASAWYAARRLLQHRLDVARHGRGTHLVNGNALVARLLRACLDRGITLWPSAAVSALHKEGAAVSGATVTTAAGTIDITTRRGVVLACGGFAQDLDRRRQLFPAHDHWTAAPPSNTGDGLALGEAAGGGVNPGGASAGAWCPVSHVRRRDGTVAVFPHLIDRARPGIIAVRADGRRFGNEADSYHAFTAALLRATPAGTEAAAWLVCDHPTLRRYGMGYAKPFPLPLRPHLRSGYLQRAETLRGLAQRVGIDATALEATAAQCNRDAASGIDPQWNRGASAFNRASGDAQHQPNPCLGEIAHAPFYAIKVVPGSLGTFAGLRTDASARVLDRDNTPIPGLFAVGNDMDSIMGGHYPAGGITLGPAMTFGYIAGNALAAAAPVAREPAA